MDFDPIHNVLYTGDEMGWIQRWDLNKLFDKLEEVKKKEFKGAYKRGADGLEDKIGISGDKKAATIDTTFVTGVDMGMAVGSIKSKIEFSASDIDAPYKWPAHTDTINYITYVPDLDCIASCSFDCNVYMWKWRPPTEDKPGEMRKIGSLVLGTERLWKIKIDKMERLDYEKREAEEMLAKVESMTLDQLLVHKKKDATNERPTVQALKEEHDDLQKELEK
jgi:hypothetical protein